MRCLPTARLVASNNGALLDDHHYLGLRHGRTLLLRRTTSGLVAILILLLRLVVLQLEEVVLRSGNWAIILCFPVLIFEKQCGRIGQDALQQDSRAPDHH